jgi:predicted nucleotidyltransferase component of viral defense system
MNIKSLMAKLLNIAKAKNLNFQNLLNRFASEQFLYRLSLSEYSQKFIFKGGSLLTYLIESERKTKDLDFSIKQLSNQVDDMMQTIHSVLTIPVDDGIEWQKVTGSPLEHPEMDYPGVRLACPFLIGKTRGTVHMDMALGDVVDAILMPLERLSYRNELLGGKPFSLLAYSPETVFAEKLQISLRKGGQNTRMKDYYDLVKLIAHGLDRAKLKKCIVDVFANRETPIATQIQFEDAEHTQLQTYWEHFLKREKMTDVPANIKEMIDVINAFLKTV